MESQKNTVEQKHQTTTKSADFFSSLGLSEGAVKVSEKTETLKIEVSFFEWASLIAQGHAAFQFLWNGIQFNIFEMLEKMEVCL